MTVRNTSQKAKERILASFFMDSSESNKDKIKLVNKTRGTEIVLKRSDVIGLSGSNTKMFLDFTTPEDINNAKGQTLFMEGDIVERYVIDNNVEVEIV